jgi:hypothetical protein
LKLNGTHQLLVSAHDVNILGGSIRAVKENAEALIVAAKEKVRECLLSFGEEFFVFQFPIQKFKD